MAQQNSPSQAQSRTPFAAATNLTKGLTAQVASIPTSVVSVENLTTPTTDAGIKRGINKMTQAHPPPKNLHKVEHKQHTQTQNRAPTPVKCDKLDKWLEGYPQDKLDFLISGYKVGFKLGFDGSHSEQDSANLKSAFEHEGFVSKKIAEELDKGRLGGPLETKPFSNFKLSPLGVVPKKETRGISYDTPSVVPSQFRAIR